MEPIRRWHADRIPPCKVAGAQGIGEAPCCPTQRRSQPQRGLPPHDPTPCGRPPNPTQPNPTYQSRHSPRSTPERLQMQKRTATAAGKLELVIQTLRAARPSMPMSGSPMQRRPGGWPAIRVWPHHQLAHAQPRWRYCTAGTAGAMHRHYLDTQALPLKETSSAQR